MFHEISIYKYEDQMDYHQASDFMKIDKQLEFLKPYEI